jgi:hypothetical protein
MIVGLDNIPDLVTKLFFEGRIDYVIQSAGISQRAIASETRWMFIKN